MYGRETIELALEAIGLGFSTREAAELAGCGRSAVGNWARGKLPRSITSESPADILRVERPADEGEGSVEEQAAEEGVPQAAGDGPDYPDIDPEDKDALIERLRLENDILRGVNAVLKVAAPGELSNREKALVIGWLRAETGRGLGELTASLGISKSSYERRRARLGRPTRREALGPEVERVFREEGRCARGYRFVTAVLSSELGEPVSEKIVRDVMRERGLAVVYAKRPKRYSSYAGETDERPENLPLNDDGTHDFHADAPNGKWVSNITEFKLPDDPRKACLSPVVDLFDSKPVAWRIGTSPDRWLAAGSLRDACATLRPGERPFRRTDGGRRCRHEEWKAACAEFGIVRSMSRKGRSPDNAACEGFFGRLKNEFFYGRDWRGVTAEEFMARLDAWMRYYSEDRLRVFREDGRRVYDTIDGRRRRLGLAA